METKMEEKRNENIVSIDTGKTRSYVVVEERGKTTREGYTKTSKEGFAEFISGVEDPIIITDAKKAIKML